MTVCQILLVASRYMAADDGARGSWTQKSACHAIGDKGRERDSQLLSLVAASASTRSRLRH